MNRGEGPTDPPHCSTVGPFVFRLGPMDAPSNEGVGADEKRRVSVPLSNEHITVGHVQHGPLQDEEHPLRTGYEQGGWCPLLCH